MPRTVTSRAVRSYRTLSPLPAEAGGLLSAALSVGSRRPGVTWHLALWSPDFPRERKRPRDCLTHSGAKTTLIHPVTQTSKNRNLLHQADRNRVMKVFTFGCFHCSNHWQDQAHQEQNRVKEKTDNQKRQQKSQ